MNKQILNHLLKHRNRFGAAYARPATKEQIEDYFAEYAEQYEREDGTKHALYLRVCSDLNLTPIKLSVKKAAKKAKKKKS